MQLNFGSAGHSLQFRYPPVGVFQCGKEAFIFRRRPARQYRRGICMDNSLLSNVTRFVVGNRAKWNMQEISAAFKHHTFTKSEALTLLGAGKVGSVALPENYALSLSVDMKPDYLMFHWSNPIARIDASGKFTTVYESSYESVLKREWNCV